MNKRIGKTLTMAALAVSLAGFGWKEGPGIPPETAFAASEEGLFYGIILDISESSVVLENAVRDGDVLTTDGSSTVYAIGEDCAVRRAGEEEGELGTEDLAAGDIVCIRLNYAKEAGVIELYGSDSLTVQSAEETESQEESETEQQTETVTLQGAYIADGIQESRESASFEGSGEDESAVLAVNGAFVTLKNAVIQKSGGTSSLAQSLLYGLNAAVNASGSSSLNLEGAEIASDGEGAAALFATGERSSVMISDSELQTSENYAPGVSVSRSGSAVLADTNVSTSGDGSGALCSLTEYAVLTAQGGSLKTLGSHSPLLLAEGSLTAEQVNGDAANSPILTLYSRLAGEISLSDCSFTSEGECGVLIQGFNADSETQTETESGQEGTAGNNTQAQLSVLGGMLSLNSDGPMILAQGARALVRLEEAEITGTSNTLLRAESLGDENGANTGANVTVEAARQELAGDIVCDSGSTAQLSLELGSRYEGAVDSAGQGAVSVSLSEDSTWIVTGDSYVQGFSDEDADLSNIQDQGYTIYYDALAEECQWLGGETLELSQGGVLTPAVQEQTP